MSGFDVSAGLNTGSGKFPKTASSKKTVYRYKVATLLWLLMLMLSGNKIAYAENVEYEEADNTGWSIQIDNDLFAGGAADQDYTGGIALTLSGDRVTRYRFTPERLRNKLDRVFGLSGFLSNENYRSVHALEFGAALFTPSDISKPQANPLDRPYASLFFLNSTHQTIIPKRKLSIKSGLTIGVLGLDLAESLQTGLHNVVGGIRPKGWRNQISQGGEITAKYSLAFQRAAFQRRYSNSLGQEVNWTGKVELGFNTGVGAGFNWRFGRIQTPWWSFNPHQSEFNLGGNVATGARAKHSRVKERYVYAGSTVNYSIYNVLVQGQFRDRSVAVDRSNVVPLSAEVWGGFTFDLGEYFRADVFLRSRTRDIDLPESRRLTWGGLTISRSF